MCRQAIGEIFFKLANALSSSDECSLHGTYCAKKGDDPSGGYPLTAPPKRYRCLLSGAAGFNISLIISMAS